MVVADEDTLPGLRPCLCRAEREERRIRLLQTGLLAHHDKIKRSGDSKDFKLSVLNKRCHIGPETGLNTRFFQCGKKRRNIRIQIHIFKKCIPVGVRHMKRVRPDRVAVQFTEDLISDQPIVCGRGLLADPCIRLGHRFAHTALRLLFSQSEMLRRIAVHGIHSCTVRLLIVI